MLVTMKSILDKASEGMYAVAAPNIWSEVDCRACIDAATELHAPLIIDVAYPANPNFVWLGQIAVKMAKEASIPVAVNLDHGADVSQVLQAVQAGFTSVMIDRSAYPYSRNVTDTKEIVKLAHALGMTVEAELGHVGMADRYEEDRNAALTSPETAKKFVEETGVDCLAVAIGTAHGAYAKGQAPYLDFDRLSQIKKAVGIPLVLHGSSGTDSEDLWKVCRMGINKVNIANDLCRAACDAAKAADFEGNKAYGFYDVTYSAVKEKLKEMIAVYGSVDKA
ncbi:MAG: class II fructose-bisphosphate aldolase [Erysipelotrichaceae bacterium]|nr:class II fructose-bisphosphate aldolase [Erysipelotrichaceae bacterium]